ncbi:helix-turn-helix domain-containing protein [Natribaculum luteum]|uniref:helix-turn-helix domain-containing protein n=1 Tax=Natribaculum luteum TaxID=1586232 RepID=UPI001FF4CDDF|nr:helix-turn-helix domain-containing protein [Natribaculum luteum]
MGRLDDITLEELYDLKDQIDKGKPRERVLAAIGRKQGDQLETLADRHGVVEKTIRNWLDRFEEEPIEQAPYDAPRPGGPAKIEGEDREQLFEQLQQPPTELGYDQQAWSAKLLLHHDAKEDTASNTTKTYAYDLLKEAGCPCGQHGLNIMKPTLRESRVPRNSRKKRPELTDKTVVVVDQHTNTSELSNDVASTRLAQIRQ